MTEDLKEKITVLIVDDHPWVRRGLTDLFAQTEDIEVVGISKDGRDAVLKTIKHSPDVVLMDISMPYMDGIEACGFLLKACPEARVVMLTSFPGKERVKQALAAGAVGYLLKDTPPDELLRCVRSAAHHGIRVNDL